MEDTDECPYCLCPCYANFVHNGIGYVQVSPFECEYCQTRQAYGTEHNLPDYDPSTRWLLPQQQTKPPKGNTMNNSKIIFVVNDDVRAISVSYEDPQPRPGGGVSEPKGYTFKTFDQSLAVDDIVVIPTNTRHGFTCAKVIAVDFDVNLDSDVDLKWIVGSVDEDSYKHTLAQEQQVIDIAQAADRKRRKDELKAAMFANAEGELAALQIVSPDAVDGDAPQEKEN